MDHQSTQAKSAVKSIAIDREAELRKIALSSLMAAAVAVAALQAVTGLQEQDAPPAPAASAIETLDLNR